MTDLKDAYEHVTRGMVSEALQASIAEQLAYFRSFEGLSVLPPVSFRTRNRLWSLYRSGNLLLSPRDIAEGVASLLVSAEIGLPQGFPTSPALFNIACHSLDSEITKILDDGLPWNDRYVWGRYSDNIIISSRERAIPTEIRSSVIDAIKRHGFAVNREKTHYLSGKSHRPCVVGITLTDPVNYRRSVSLSRKRINRYRGLIHRASVDERIPAEKVIGIIRWVSQVYWNQPIPQRLRVPIADFMLARGITEIKAGKCVHKDEFGERRWYKTPITVENIREGCF